MRRRANGFGVRFFSFAALTAVLLVLTCTDSDARRHANPNDTGLPNISYASVAPDFAFAASGAQTHLAAFEGKPVVLNFWATWCEPCAAELDAFAQLGKTYGDGVVFIAVSEEATAVTAPVLQVRGIAGSSVSDPARKIFGLYGLNTLTSIPVTVVLGRNGRVGHVSIGELDWAELQAAVDTASLPLASPTLQASP